MRFFERLPIVELQQNSTILLHFYRHTRNISPTSLRHTKSIHFSHSQRQRINNGLAWCKYTNRIADHRRYYFYFLYASELERDERERLIPANKNITHELTLFYVNRSSQSHLRCNDTISYWDMALVITMVPTPGKYAFR